MLKRYFLAAAVAAGTIGQLYAAVNPTPTGEWLVADGTARIRIAPCNGALWGVIAWAQTPGTDQNNPDPALRSRPVVGMPILLNMKKVEPNRWDGEVYNAENGRTYTANISLVQDDVLRIEGCVFGGLFCGGENWTRDMAQPAPSETASIQKNAPIRQREAAPAKNAPLRQKEAATAQNAPQRQKETATAQNEPAQNKMCP
jgi:uncharacterized protein (DUF2147 family)